MRTETARPSAAHAEHVAGFMSPYYMDDTAFTLADILRDRATGTSPDKADPELSFPTRSLHC